MTDEIQWLVPPASLSLSGDEQFTGMPGTTVRDFWQFALGDLRMNNARGYLAEFLVGKALGIKDLKRVEWNSYDLLFGDITIQIKSSAYLQSWEQKKISALSFSGLQGTRYHPARRETAWILQEDDSTRWSTFSAHTPRPSTPSMTS